jgi:hypothetical protein
MLLIRQPPDQLCSNLLSRCLLPLDACDPGASTLLLLIVGRFRLAARHAARSLDLAISENWQSALDSECRYALRNQKSTGRMIDLAPNLATREASVRRDYCLSQRKAGGLSENAIHAIEGDYVTDIVAYSDTHGYVELARLCDRGAHD